jgi:hypothetical protein
MREKQIDGRKQINTFLPKSTAQEVEALQVRLGGVHCTTVIRIAIRKLFESEFPQNQTTPFAKKEVA